MKSIENHCFGKLAVDNSYKIGTNRDEAFHIHPHYELLVCTTPVKLKNILSGQQINTDYPLAILVSPFIPHFTSAEKGEAWGSPRTVFYFDDAVLSSCPLSFSMQALLGGGTVRVFNLSDYCIGLRQYLGLLQGTQDAWERTQLFSVILNRLFRNRERSTVFMNRPNDYILRVIDHITTHLDEKLTVETLAARFFVSRDKLKKDFKRCTYTNIGDFVQGMRLNRAKELLEGSAPIGEIVHQCGYESDSYFFKMFKAATGYTPLEFRRR